MGRGSFIYFCEVLIVAKCIVNEAVDANKYWRVNVLIVAKCIVNEAFVPIKKA